MTNPFHAKAWPPYAVGVGVGLLTWVAFATADHPLGVSTPFEQVAALSEQAVVPGVEETNGYFAAKAAEGKPPRIGCASSSWATTPGTNRSTAIASSRRS